MKNCKLDEMLETPTVAGLGDFFSDIGDAISEKASDVGDFVGDRAKALGKGLYEGAGDIVDAPGKAASEFWDSATSFVDDPIGAIQRSGERLYNRTTDTFDSVGSIASSWSDGEFYQSGEQFALLAERAGATIGGGGETIADALSISAMSQDRRESGVGGAVMFPILGAVLGAKIGEAASGAGEGVEASENVTEAQKTLQEAREAQKRFDDYKAQYDAVNAQVNQKQSEMDAMKAQYEELLRQEKTASETRLAEIQAQKAALVNQAAQTKTELDSAKSLLQQNKTNLQASSESVRSSLAKAWNAKPGSATEQGELANIVNRALVAKTEAEERLGASGETGKLVLLACLGLGAFAIFSK